MSVRAARAGRSAIAIGLLLFASSCSSPSAPAVEACGESFCVGGLMPGDLSKRTPIEDFNLYRFERNGTRFLIYEGNAPRESGGVVERVRAGRFEWELLRDAETAGARLFREHLRWPQYLVITAECPSGERCGLDELVGDVRPFDPAS